MVTTDPTVDIAQQTLPLFNGDAALQDPGVAPLIEFTLHKNKGLGTMCESSCLLVVCHGGGSRGRASSNRPEGRALLLGPLRAP